MNFVRSISSDRIYSSVLSLKCPNYVGQIDENSSKQIKLKSNSHGEGRDK